MQSLGRLRFGKVWFPVKKNSCNVHYAHAQDSILYPAELEPGQDEPELCFRNPKCETLHMHCLIVGTTHVLLPGHTLPRGARSFEITVNGAIGNEKACCWRNPLLPLGRLANLLDMQCRDKGQWKTMTNFEVRNNMANTSHIQFEVLRHALWEQRAQPQIVFNWQFWEKAAQDPKLTTYLHHGVKAKMCEATPFMNSVGTQYIAARAKIELACDSIRAQGQALNKVHGVSENDGALAQSLMTDVPDGGAQL